MRNDQESRWIGAGAFSNRLDSGLYVRRFDAARDLFMREEQQRRVVDSRKFQGKYVSSWGPWTAIRHL